jgi:Flp pilus assembly protein TadG
MTARHPRHRPGERGSAAAFTVLFSITVFLLAGLVVDGGMAISKRERAADIAEQAARRVADDVDVELLRQGVVAIRAGGAACAQLAGEVVAASGEGTLTRCDVDNAANTVTVGVRIVYRPTLLGLVTSSPFVANANAVARPVAGITGEGA